MQKKILHIFIVRNTQQMKNKRELLKQYGAYVKNSQITLYSVVKD